MAIRARFRAGIFVAFVPGQVFGIVAIITKRRHTLVEQLFDVGRMGIVTAVTVFNDVVGEFDLVQKVIMALPAKGGTGLF